MQRKLVKTILKIFIVVIALSQISLINAFAEDITLPSNVELIGNTEGIVMISNDGNFLESLNMLPGDSVSRQLLLKNEYSYEYDIYVRAEKGITTDDYDLLDKLQLVAEYDGKVIYEGPATGEDDKVNMSENISLGTLKPGEEKVLDAKAVLPGEEIGNEYKNKETSVKWIFTAIRKDGVPVEPELPETEDPELPETGDPQLPQTGDPITIYLVEVIVGTLMILAGFKLKMQKNLKDNK